MTLTGLPVGTYTVTETTTGNFSTTYTVNDGQTTTSMQSATITTANYGTTQAVTVENTYPKKAEAEISITKEVSGTNAPTTIPDAFKFKIEAVSTTAPGLTKETMPVPPEDPEEVVTEDPTQDPNVGNLTFTDLAVEDELTGNSGDNAWTIIKMKRFLNSN